MFVSMQARPHVFSWPCFLAFRACSSIRLFTSDHHLQESTRLDSDISDASDLEHCQLNDFHRQAFPGSKAKISAPQHSLRAHSKGSAWNSQMPCFCFDPLPLPPEEAFAAEGQNDTSTRPVYESAPTGGPPFLNAAIV